MIQVHVDFLVSVVPNLGRGKQTSTTTQVSDGSIASIVILPPRLNIGLVAGTTIDDVGLSVVL